MLFYSQNYINEKNVFDIINHKIPTLNIYSRKTTEKKLFVKAFVLCIFNFNF